MKIAGNFLQLENLLTLKCSYDLKIPYDSKIGLQLEHVLITKRFSFDSKSSMTRKLDFTCMAGR